MGKKISPTNILGFFPNMLVLIGFRSRALRPLVDGMNPAVRIIRNVPYGILKVMQDLYHQQY